MGLLDGLGTVSRYEPTFPDLSEFKRVGCGPTPAFIGVSRLNAYGRHQICNGDLAVFLDRFGNVFNHINGIAASVEYEVLHVRGLRLTRFTPFGST